MKLLVKNGRLVDPANNLDDIRDILVEGEKIINVSRSITADADKTIDASGRIVMPGLVDMHVHLREPGREDKETVLSGTLAALKGGVTTVLAMPNTNPCMDSADNIRLLKSIVDRTAKANVFLCSALTMSRQGREMVDYARVRKEGPVVAASDDGSSVESDDLMQRAMVKAREQRMLVICHCEDKGLAAGGVMNLGAFSTRLGLRGISNESEYKRVQRDIQLSQKTRTPVHIAHVSCAESVELIAKARKKGARVTAETAPHYFSLTEDAVLDYDTNKKMNPPLRSSRDRDAIRQGLAKGIIDCIASDHAPHTVAEKDVEFDRAEFGVTGLETELAAGFTYLVKPGILTWPDIVNKLAVNPARILGVDKGTLSVGKDADITIFDPEAETQVRPEDLISKSKNSAFLGMRLAGRVAYTIYRGAVVYAYGIHS